MPARETAAILERVKKEKNKDITIAILSGADHSMNRPTGTRPVPEYAETMISWILRRVNVSNQTAHKSDRRVALLSLPLLRTVRASFPAHGSSLSNAL